MGKEKSKWENQRGQKGKTTARTPVAETTKGRAKRVWGPGEDCWGQPSRATDRTAQEAGRGGGRGRMSGPRRREVMEGETAAQMHRLEKFDIEGEEGSS